MRKNDPYRLTEFQLRRRVDLEGNSLWIVSREDLILSKLAWAQESESDYQLRDVSGLIDDAMDRNYLDSWIRELGLTDTWGQVQAL